MPFTGRLAGRHQWHKIIFNAVWQQTDRRQGADSYPCIGSGKGKADTGIYKTKIL